MSPDKVLNDAKRGDVHCVPRCPRISGLHASRNAFRSEVTLEQARCRARGDEIETADSLNYVTCGWAPMKVLANHAGAVEWISPRLQAIWMPRRNGDRLCEERYWVSDGRIWRPRRYPAVRAFSK